MRWLKAAVLRLIPKDVIRSVRLPARCVMRFGVIDGLRLWRGLARASGRRSGASERSVGSVRVPGYGCEIHVRPQTSDIDVFIQVFLKEEYRIELPFEPRVVIDAGANVGYSAMYFATRYPGALVIAIEPEASNFKMLAHHAENFPQVRVIQAALWWQAEPLRFHDPEAEKWSFRTEPADQADGSLNVVTLDQMINDYRIDSIDLLKLDVEGAEKEILEHCDSFIERVRVLVVELHERYSPGCTEAFLAAVRWNFTLSTRGEHSIAIRCGDPCAAAPPA